MHERDWFKEIFNMSTEEFRARYISGVDPINPPTDNSSNYFSRIDPNINNHVFDRRGIMDQIERLENQNTYEGVALRITPEPSKYEEIDEERLRGIIEGMGEATPSQNRPLFIHTNTQEMEQFDKAIKDAYEKELRELERKSEVNSEFEELEKIYKETKSNIKVNKSSEKHKNIKWK